MKSPDSRPLILGHRGARREAPENTLPTFRRALEMGADGVEFDVRLSCDGHPVVIHDADLRRTSDGRGAVSQATLEQLRRLDVGSWFGPAFAGTRLPTLDEALELLAPAALVNIELKGPAHRDGGLERRVLEAVREAGMAEHVIISSFAPAHLWRLRRYDGQVALAWLHGPLNRGWPGLLLARLLKLQALHPFHHVLSERYLRRARRGGLQVIPWTVNEAAQTRRLAAWGVDAIITDKPAEMRQWVDAP